MATIVKRSSGYWQAKIRIKGYPSRSETFPSKALAEAWAKEIEANLHRTGFVQDKKKNTVLFSDLVKDFSEKFAPEHYRGRAWKYKVDALEKRLGNYYLTTLTPDVIAKYRDERLKDRDSRYTKNIDDAPAVSPATVKSEIDILSTMLDVARREFGYITPDRQRIMDVRRPKAGRFRDRRLNEGEWERLLTECAKSGNPLLSSAFEFTVATGVRQGELLSMQWEDLNSKQCYVMLRNPEKIKNQEIRAVPLSSRAMSVLDNLPGERTGQIFKLPKGTLYSAFRHALKRAQIDNLTWHDLRHEALSRIAEMDDFNLIEIAAISGHKNLQTLKRYIHLQARKLAQKLG